MTNWRQGGWTGSLNAWVGREIQQHFRENKTARRSRYPRITRLGHRIFDDSTFARFIAVYVTLALAVAAAELVSAAYFPALIPQWSGTNEIKPLLGNVTSYLISAQVGLLGVISIAIGLVTIIAQRDNASTDVQLYYHESFAFGIVASSIALLAALCAQLLWPAHFLLHWLGYGTSLQIFKISLTALHIAWLLVNLIGIAHFVAITLGFVQQTSRENLREYYTTNVVLPAEMRKRLRQQLYLTAGPEFVKEFHPPSGSWRNPTVYLGVNFGDSGEVEIPLGSSEGLVLADVRMAWVRWAVGRWLTRCRATEPNAGKNLGGLRQEPFLLFPQRLDEVANASHGLCRRSGSLPLTKLEKLVLHWAFKFRRVRDEA